MPIRLRCAGCGAEPARSQPFPFRCPRSGADDDIDHALRRVFEPDERLRESFRSPDPDPNPFLRFRALLAGYQRALEDGWSDDRFVERTRWLDHRVEQIDGAGFRATPFDFQPVLARELGVADLWIKDETGNVSGSHKARHFMGLALWLEVVREGRELPRLAIASCGNAALGAAVTARAAGFELDVYVPTWVHPSVQKRLGELEARIVECPRAEESPGDPCYREFRRAVEAGSLPFTCQGNENGLVIEGGQTLAWEMAGQLSEHDATLDRLFVQVGGGALATACIQGFEEAHQLGLHPLPRIHAVQSEGAAPLRRGWERFGERVLGSAWTGLSDPVRADRLASLPGDELTVAVRYAARHRSEFMWPWESEPKSVASGILDDETYDWLPVLEGMFRTGGWPVVVGEDRLVEAHGLARRYTASRVDPTGSAGLAGALQLRRKGGLGAKESIGVLFTGVERD